jgi:hypothetical protein
VDADDTAAGLVALEAGVDGGLILGFRDIEILRG